MSTHDNVILRRTITAPGSLVTRVVGSGGGAEPPPSRSLGARFASPFGRTLRVLRGAPLATRLRAAALRNEGLLFGALGVWAFSLSMVSTRAAAPALGGLFVGLGRGFVAAILAIGVLWARREPLPARRHWPGLVVIAVGSVITFPVLSARALEHLPASHGLVFTALLPAVTAAVAVVRTRERPGARFWVAAVAGAAVVATFALRHGGGMFQSADAQLLIGMVASALAYVEGGRLSRELGGTVVLSWSLVFALPVVAPVFGAMVILHPPHAGATAWLGFGYVSVFSMYLGFLAWYRGMARGGIARVSQIQTLQPLLGLGWSALLLGEPLSLDLVVSAVCVIVLVAWGRG